MRFLVIIWMLFIFIATCTNDVHAFLHEQNVSFSFTSPNIQDFKLFYPINEISSFEMIGHLLMFLCLTLLLLTSTKRVIALVISVKYAILTEFLQLFFGRGAELYDILANIAGILVALLIVSLGGVIHKSDSIAS